MVDRQVSEPQAGPQTDHHAAAFEAFVEYTQVAGATSEVRELAQKAIKVLEARVGGGTALYGEPDGNLWKARAWSEHFSPDGLALVTSDDWAPPLVTEVLRARDIVFRETFERASGPLGVYGAVAACPVLLGSEVRGLLVLLLPEASSWTGHARAVMQAVGHGLALALERAEVTRQLDEERNALATFAAFTEAVSSATDIPTLVQLAFSVLPRRFPQAVVGYYEPVGEVWKLRAYTGSVSSDLIGVATGGKVPVHPDALSAIRNNEVTFVDNWGTRFESLLGNHQFGKVAFYPLAVGGEVRAGLVFGVQTLRVWGERDKALVRAIGRSFNLAFERTTTAAALKEQQAELDGPGRWTPS